MDNHTETKDLAVVAFEPTRPTQLSSLGFSDYTAERKELFKNLTSEDVVKGIEEMRKHKQRQIASYQHLEETQVGQEAIISKAIITITEKESNISISIETEPPLPEIDNPSSAHLLAAHLMGIGLERIGITIPEEELLDAALSTEFCNRKTDH
jgi:hypothetical protein